MSKYVLRTVGRVDLPAFDAMEVDANGIGHSIAWFWNENEAREYMNKRAEIESLRNELIRLKDVVGECDSELIDQILNR